MHRIGHCNSVRNEEQISDNRSEKWEANIKMWSLRYKDVQV